MIHFPNSQNHGAGSSKKAVPPISGAGTAAQNFSGSSAGGGASQYAESLEHAEMERREPVTETPKEKKFEYFSNEQEALNYLRDLLAVPELNIEANNISDISSRLNAKLKELFPSQDPYSLLNLAEVRSKSSSALRMLGYSSFDQYA